MRHASRFHPLTLALLLTSTGAQAGQADLPPDPKASRFAEVALCVAALEREVKSDLHPKPTPEERKQWQQRLESAFAHTGQSYLAGLSGEGSKALLHAAETTVASWPESRLKLQAESCHAQGLTLLNQASGLEQLIVRKAATRLLDKELAKLPPPATD